MISECYRLPVAGRRAQIYCGLIIVGHAEIKGLVTGNR